MRRRSAAAKIGPKLDDVKFGTNFASVTLRPLVARSFLSRSAFFLMYL